MARVRGYMSLEDYPVDATPDVKAHAKALFSHMFPGRLEAKIPDGRAAIGIVAREPVLALHLLRCTEHMSRTMSWTSGHALLRELMIQVVNLHRKCELGYQSHLRSAQSAGLSIEKQALIPLWESAGVFSEDERLVIEFTLAVLDCKVTDPLFDRVKARFGENGSVEFTAAIAWWSFWATVINATGVHHDFGTV